MVTVLVLCYDRIKDLAQARTPLAIHDGSAILELERKLHIAVELQTNHWLAAHRMLAYAEGWYYQVAHLTVTLAVLLFCYLRHPALYRPARNALVLINVFGLLVFWVYPVAPPRLLPSAGFVDITMQTGASDASNTSAPNPYAAMPSLHTGWAIWVVVIGFLAIRAMVTRTLLLVHAALTFVVIVATGNHYLLDLAGGLLVGLLALVLTGLLHRQRLQSVLEPPTPAGSGFRS